MMKKVLKNHTIIPKDLYVSRDADRQLAAIIEEMGRPGYILVSRQMGKTNLLLNAKREMESDDIIFVYIDISNPPDQSRDCFRNIIDTALSSHSRIFLGLTDIIRNDRDFSVRMPPNIEHEKELLLLLRNVKGKLVIVIDEIDALTSTRYSDQLFAQIRSSYFASRTTYEEYNRLTYILSGVIEPSNIIKDKNKSPFNIGDKIYLDDFTYSEFLSLTDKINVKLANDAIDQVFCWAKGHPRMSWDIMSELENIALMGTEVNKETVDDVVNKLYLFTFDKAPIDNIRYIVESDREVRDAIVTIRYNKGESINDSVKSKLYLAGIISSNQIGDVEIKNKIIDMSLSDSWLQNIDIKKKGVLRVAHEKFNEFDYGQAVILYDEYLRHNKIENLELSNSIYFRFGSSCYYMGKYDRGIELLNNVMFDKYSHRQNHNEAKHLLALCHTQLGQYTESIKAYECISLDDTFKDKFYYKYKINIALAYAEHDFKLYKEKIFSIYKDLLDYIEVLPDDSEIKSIYTSPLSANLALAYERDNKLQEAKTQYLIAAKYCDLNKKPGIYFKLFMLEENYENKCMLLNGAIDAVIDNELLPTTYDKFDTLKFSAYFLNNILISAYELEKYERFDYLANYTLAKIYPSNSDRYFLLTNLSKHALQYSKYPIAKKILNDIISLGCENTGTKYYVTKSLCLYFDSDTNIASFRNGYIQCLKSGDISTLDLDDMLIVAKMITDLLDLSRHHEVKDLIEICEHYYDELDVNTKYNYNIIKFLEVRMLYEVSEIGHAQDKARDLRVLISEMVSNPDSDKDLYGEEGIKFIERYLDNVLKTSITNHPYINIYKNFGKNDVVKVKYKNGNILNTKFKKVEKDLRAGRCQLL